MTFRVNGIKQRQADTTPIVLVVETDSELLVRKLLEKYTILVLSLNEFTQDPKTFGDVRAKVKRGFDGITIVSQGTDVQTVCENLLDLGLDIAEINSFSKPLPDADMQKILETAREKIAKKQATEQQSMESKKEEQRRIYDDPKLARAKTVVAWIFDRVPDILQRLKGQLDAQEIKHINVLQEDLKKLRMGTNYEKIRDLAGEILLRMQNKEELFYRLHSENAKLVIDGSVVTDQDVAREEMKLLYTQQRKFLGAKISVLTEQYALFGRASLWWIFFQKDIWRVISSPSTRLYYLYDTALLCVGLLLSMAGGFIVYNLLWPTLDTMDGLRYQLISYGSLGLLLWIGTFWKKKHIGNLILIYGLTIVTYRLLIELIVTNFALVT